MIVWRALQGFIGGGMIPSVFAAAYTIFPRSRQGMISAIVGLIATLAPTVGPTVGGYLTNLFSWHWLFLVNVFPGIAVTIATLLLVDFDKPNLKLLRTSTISAWRRSPSSSAASNTCWRRARRMTGSRTRRSSLFAVVAVVAGIAFFWRVLTAREADRRPPGLLDRNFATGSLFIFMLGIGLYGLVYLYPVYLARVRGYDSLQIGETMFVTGIFMMITAPISGHIAQRADPRIMMAVGMSLVRDLLPRAGADHQGLGLRRTLHPAGAARRRADGGDDPGLDAGARHASAGAAQERLGPLQPDAQSRRRRRPRRHHHAAERPLGPAHRSACTKPSPGAARRRPSGSPRSPRSVSSALGSDADMAALKMLANRVRGEALVMAFSDIFLILAVLFFAIVLFVPLAKRPAARAAAGH